MGLLLTLHTLEAAPCDKCDGWGFFEDADQNAHGCAHCGGTGQMEVCAGCGEAPRVGADGCETCGCYDEDGNAVDEEAFELGFGPEDVDDPDSLPPVIRDRLRRDTWGEAA